MLHEILLSLSGHPSPLLKKDDDDSPCLLFLSPQERELLRTIAHLSDVHFQIIAATRSISLQQQSSICQAVAASIKSTHLARFQAKILQVERDILQKDAIVVGKYNIVPLTIIVNAFSEWIRRMEWFLEVCHYIQQPCTGPHLIGILRNKLQTGYADVVEVAHELVRVAETAWLRQVCTWLLYGRLPTMGAVDFLVYSSEEADAQIFKLKDNCRPEFVTHVTASSILFIGDCLHQIRIKSMNVTSDMAKVQSKGLQLLSGLSFPLSSTTFTGVIVSIRSHLSQTVLYRLLPPTRIAETLNILHEYFLLGRGEFAIALIHEADEKFRSRRRIIEKGTYDKGTKKLTDIQIKDSEVKAILSRAWTTLTSLDTLDEDGDILNTARSLISLDMNALLMDRQKPISSDSASKLASTPFNSLLLSVPVYLTLQIPSPLDLFLSSSDVQTYSQINAYLLSIRRAHTHLAGLWKMTSLRRSHPAPLASQSASRSAERTLVMLRRERERVRSIKLRKIWATSSAAMFLLAETEAYLHGEVIKTMWDDFKSWLSKNHSDVDGTVGNKGADESRVNSDIWRLAEMEPVGIAAEKPNPHDPQTLSMAHKAYLSALTTHLLLTIPSFTDAIYTLMQQCDYLVASVDRIQLIWSILDLETDQGVVDAFLDFSREERDAEGQLTEASSEVKLAIESLVQIMRVVDQGKDDLINSPAADIDLEGGGFVPANVGRIDRLLMKLDFGGWFHGDESSYDHMELDSDVS